VLVLPDRLGQKMMKIDGSEPLYDSPLSDMQQYKGVVLHLQLSEVLVFDLAEDEDYTVTCTVVDMNDVP